MISIILNVWTYLMAQEINPPRHQSARTRREPRRAPRPPRDQAGDLARLSRLLRRHWVSVDSSDRPLGQTRHNEQLPSCEVFQRHEQPERLCPLLSSWPPRPPVHSCRSSSECCPWLSGKRQQARTPPLAPPEGPAVAQAGEWPCPSGSARVPGRTRPALASRSASARQPQLSAVRATPELGAPCPPPRLPGPGAHAAFLHPPLFLTVHRASGPAEGFVTRCLSSGTLRSCPQPQEVTWGPERPQG